MIKFKESSYGNGWIWAQIDKYNIVELHKRLSNIQIYHAGFDTETNGLDIRSNGSRSFLNAYGILYKDSDGVLHKEVFTFASDDIDLLSISTLLNQSKYLWAYNAKFDLNILLNTYGEGIKKETFNFANWYDVLSLWRLTHNVDEPILNLELKKVASRELNLDAKQMQDVVKKTLSNLMSDWNKKLIDYYKPSGVVFTPIIINAIKKGDIFQNKKLIKLFWEYTKTNPLPNYQTVWEQHSQMVEEYASWDVAMMLDLVILLFPQLKQREQCEILELEHKVLKVIAEQERNGVAINIDYLYESRDRVIDYYNYLEKTIKDLIIYCQKNPAINCKDADNYNSIVNVFIKKKIKKEFISRDRMKTKVDNFLKNWNSPEFEGININSSDQINIFMWVAFGLTSQTGNWDKVQFRETLYKLDLMNFEDNLDLARDKTNAQKFINTILTYRKVSKWANTYIGRFIVEYENNNTGRIYPSFSPYKVVTGRMSSPFQQQPKELLVDIRNNEPLFSPRKMVKCSDDAQGVLVFDLSQIEIRINAHYTHLIGKPDQVLDEVLFKGGDMHTITAAHAFHYDEFIKNKEESLALVTKDERNKAKSLNFAMQYGGGKNAIVSHPELGKLSETVQNKLLEAFKQTREGTVTYQKWAIGQMKTTYKYVGSIMLNYVENMYKRRYYATPNWVSNESYKVINYLIQGTCADALKSSLIKIYEYLHENNLKSRIILNIHDEVQVEVLNNEWHIVKTIKKLMEDVDFKTDIPIICDVEVYKTTWDDKQDYKLEGNNE